MAFNITEIMSTIGYYNGIHRPSHFYVRIYPPTWLGDRQIVRDFQFVCDAVNLPGVNLETLAIRPMGYGTPESRPVDVSYQRVRCDFFVDNGDQVMTTFNTWMNNIVNADIDIRTTSAYTDLKYYEFAYPKDYEGVIEIYMFSSEGYVIRKVTLHQAFPVDIGELGLAWEINDSISRVPVTFAYNLWTSDIPQGAEAEEVAQQFASTRNNLEAYTTSGLYNTGGGAAP